MIRGAAQAWAIAAASLGGGCGTCLVVATRDSTLTTRDGVEVPVRISERLDGFMERLDRDQLALAILTAPLCELLDWLYTVPSAAHCLCSANLHIEGGPFGLVAALTPFATVNPGLQVLRPAPRDVDPADVARLRGTPGPEREAALRRIFPDPDVRAVTIR